MSRFDPDVVAVRDLPPGRLEPSAESVSRTWRTITRRLASRGSRLRRRWLVPVIAAAVAALVMGGWPCSSPGGTRPRPRH